MANCDLLKLALQMTFPSNDILYDDVGDPSVMVRIPKFKISDVIRGGSDRVHPAFIVNGEEKDEIWISKFQNVVINERAYSLPAHDPADYITHEQAWQYCKQKGPGWHLITNAEWAAIALWCKANGFMPKGNNNYGKDVSESALPQKALPSWMFSETKIGRTATGTGYQSWYHDNTFGGIADLNGNVWEWNTGMRLVDGEINILENNDAADWNNPVTPDSKLWKAIMPDGTLAAPGTSGTLKYDYVNGKIILTAGPVTDTSGAKRSTAFTLLGKDASVADVPEIVKALALFPDGAAFSPELVWVVLTGEMLPRRGGDFNSALSPAGVFSLGVNHERDNTYHCVGFRSAFCRL